MADSLERDRPLARSFDSFAGERTFEIPPDTLEDYFLAFALRVSS